jgi:hypothetical protein
MVWLCHEDELGKAWSVYEETGTLLINCSSILRDYIDLMYGG